MKANDRIRIDADTKEFGRVTGAGYVIKQWADLYLVHADSIRAAIIVRKHEVHAIEEVSNG